MQEESGRRGLMIFGGTIMLVAGAFNMIQGLIALFRNEIFVTTEKGLVVFDFTSWGVFLLAIGGILAITGIGVLADTTWGRVLGIIIASINAIGQVTFITALPVWSILVIALDVMVIYALATYKSEAVQAREERAEYERRKAA